MMGGGCADNGWPVMSRCPLWGKEFVTHCKPMLLTGRFTSIKPLFFLVFICLLMAQTE